MCLIDVCSLKRERFDLKMVCRFNALNFLKSMFVWKNWSLKMTVFISVRKCKIMEDKIWITIVPPKERSLVKNQSSRLSFLAGSA